MIYTFEYNGTSFTSEDIIEIEQFVFQWIEDNWDAFVAYGNNKHGYVTKDNYDDIIESFYEDTIKEEENDIR
jgi:hypothetical protein